jgi:uncharacterized protein
MPIDETLLRRPEPKERLRYVKVLRSGLHGRGLFARCTIPQGTKVIEYVGEKITKAESEDRAWAQMEKAAKTGGAAVYMFTLNKRYDLDGNVAWNTARLINHSCDPNCETDIIRGRVWVFSLRQIEEGEELTFNYGFDLEDYEAHPCRCGTGRCIGFIASEEYWPELRRRVAQKERRRRLGIPEEA